VGVDGRSILCQDRNLVPIEQAGRSCRVGGNWWKVEGVGCRGEMRRARPFMRCGRSARNSRSSPDKHGDGFYPSPATVGATGELLETLSIRPLGRHRPHRQCGMFPSHPGSPWDSRGSADARPFLDCRPGGPGHRPAAALEPGRHGGRDSGARGLPRCARPSLSAVSRPAQPPGPGHASLWGAPTGWRRSEYDIQVVKDTGWAHLLVADLTTQRAWRTAPDRGRLLTRLSEGGWKLYAQATQRHASPWREKPDPVGARAGERVARGGLGASRC
jgi:hypothetical protein